MKRLKDNTICEWPIGVVADILDALAETKKALAVHVPKTRAGYHEQGSPEFKAYAKACKALDQALRYSADYGRGSDQIF